MVEQIHKNKNEKDADFNYTDKEINDVCKGELPFVQSLEVEKWQGNTRGRVVYKSRQPAKFAGFSARFRRLLSLLQEQRYVELMFFRAKLY